MYRLQLPNIREVKKYQRAFRKKEEYARYIANQTALDLLYKQIIPENNTLEAVLLKVSSLNDFYSTNILDTYSVAKHIFNIENLDQRLKCGDLDLVDEIKTVRIGDGDKTMNFYSFATKFCANHNESAYPIYDRFVDAMLRYFRNTGYLPNFSNDDLKSYRCFVRVITGFKAIAKLERCSFREIDRYLWLKGKEMNDEGIIKVTYKKVKE